MPLGPRNRLAAVIVAAISDAGARAELLALAGAAVPLAGWLADDEMRHAGPLLARARAAARALEREPVVPPAADLDATLRVAAALFDAGLGFEVHEVLESRWTEASGATREALQGLIQIAVGYQHAANGNGRGAYALLTEGAGRLAAGALPGLDLAAFGAAVRASVTTGTLAPPRFPRAARAA
ncbi:MAG: DUF309 domain-containing protein [Candidatus Rokubacteria bacterium]|nr:DUF309 domain-containing protein [Candidatus Rokubacteria bacterium]